MSSDEWEYVAYGEDDIIDSDNIYYLIQRNNIIYDYKLDSDGFNRLPDWKDAVKRYSKVLKKEGNK